MELGSVELDVALVSTGGVVVTVIDSAAAEATSLLVAVETVIKVCRGCCSAEDEICTVLLVFDSN